jgi:predicted TPR repeat methyltransferase
LKARQETFMAAASDAALAHRLFREARYTDAAEACRRVVASTPGDVDAQHLLARILIEQWRPAIAVMALEQLLAAHPESADIRATLGRAHRVLGDTGSARAALERALADDPANVRARVELAFLHVEAGDPAEALAELADARERAPEDPDVGIALARARVAAGQIERGREAFAAAVRRDPTVRRALTRLAVLQRNLGHDDHARATLEAALALDPDDPELRHSVAAATGQRLRERASDAYVTQHFDRFADLFDTVLRDHLRYRIPELIAARVASRREDRAGDLDILDAGCGTGLCGPGLRPLARRLVGVDLSPRMLEHAARRGTYDELHHEEITAHLARRSASFDVIAAADVFVYFGDLHEVLGLMASALRPEGVVVFSVERLDTDDLALRPSGRWAHSVAHLRAAATAAGLTLELEETTVRLEDERPVPGYLGVAYGS